jgi:hypothetical protein
MKTILILLIGMLPFMAQAQLETYGRYTVGGSFDPIIDYTGSTKITEKFSLTFFGLIRKSWSQALIGVSYNPSKSLSVGTSIGIEHGTNSPRYAASIWTVRGKTLFLALGELGTGHANYLYKFNLFHAYSEHYTLGMTVWRFHGVGPNFRYTLSKLSSTIWVMPAYDFEVNKGKLMVGVSVDMPK